MAQESLEIALSGKRYTISLDPLCDEVRAELKTLFIQEVEPLTLLKLYITKAQEYSLICKSLEGLYKSLESMDSIPQHSVQIEALQHTT